MLYILKFVFIFIIANITGILYTLKHIFASNNRKSQLWNIIDSLLSVSISSYLQIKRAEISFSVHHQDINDIFTLKSLFSFSDSQKYEDITVKILQGDEERKMLQCLHFLSTVTHGLMTYDCVIVRY